MDGYRGSLEITDIVEIVHRNAYRPNIRWVSSRWGRANGAPTGAATMLVGAWLTNSYGQLAEDHGTAYNVPTPFIPEYSIIDEQSGRVKARGWRAILTEMVQDKVLRPSPELERLLGKDELESARRVAGTMA